MAPNIKKKIIVTGDHCWDRFVYVVGVDDRPPNFLEAWIEAKDSWNIRLPGGAGCLAAYINALGNFKANDPFQKDASNHIELAESIYFLTKQMTKREKKEIEKDKSKSPNDVSNAARWRMGQSVVAGEKPLPYYQIVKLDKRKWSRKQPVVFVDFNQGCRTGNIEGERGAFADLFQGRPYLIRTHDPRHKEWYDLRKEKLLSKGIWFSPLQDLDGGALKFPGNWRDIRDRVVTYLQEDETLWDKDEELWLQTIVIQVWYDGALVFRADQPREADVVKIFAGDQPESFALNGYGAVLGGGIVLSATLTEALFDPSALISSVERGLCLLRTKCEEGYVGPPPGERDWKPPRNVNLPTGLQRPYEIIDCRYDPPVGDFVTVKRIVTAEQLEFKRLSSFSLGDLVTCNPTEARIFLRLLNRFRKVVDGSRQEVLSFAILGEPGSGKSFLARQLGRGADPEESKLHEMHYNLAQFSSLERLVDAFQEIQAVTMQGKTPFVLWDEFDTSFEGQQGGWWKYFLMPMEDGNFLNGNREESLGKSIFAFIGGVYQDEAEFNKEAVQSDNGRLAKGPDFHSRLGGVIQSPRVGFSKETNDDRSQDDPAKLVRALIIRRLLKEQRKDKRSECLENISEEVLAYLTHVRLRHGVRSLKQILAASELGRTRAFTLHNLPPTDVLCPHVEDDETDPNPVERFLSREDMKVINVQQQNLRLLWTNDE
jgi:hypothetical protein